MLITMTLNSSFKNINNTLSFIVNINIRKAYVINLRGRESSLWTLIAFAS